MRPSRSKSHTATSRCREPPAWEGVDRGIIEQGAERLGVTLEELIAETIEGMRGVAEAIGLAGEAGEGATG